MQLGSELALQLEETAETAEIGLSTTVIIEGARNRGGVSGDDVDEAAGRGVIIFEKIDSALRATDALETPAQTGNELFEEMLQLPTPLVITSIVWGADVMVHGHQEEGEERCSTPADSPCAIEFEIDGALRGTRAMEQALITSKIHMELIPHEKSRLLPLSCSENNCDLGPRSSLLLSKSVVV